MEQVAAVGLGDLLAIAKRRVGYFFVSLLVVFGAAVGLAIFLPPVYESKTTILIEEQQIPLDMIRTTVTDFVEQRLQSITQQFTTRQNLLELVERFDLYKKERRKESSEEIAQRFREDIALTPIATEVVDRRTGRPMTATIAFEVSYRGHDPRQVQQVTNVLASFYLSQNLKVREEHAKISSDFLEQEGDRIADEMAAIDAQLVDLKEKYLGSLPEQMGISLQTLDRLEREKAALSTRIEDFNVRRKQLEAELFTRQAAVQGRGPTPSERLKQLRIEEANLLAKYSEFHPDVAKIRREIVEIERDIEVENEVSSLQQELQTARLDLETEGDAARRKELEESISRLQERIEDLDPQAATGLDDESVRQDPFFVSTKNQLEGVTTSIRSLEEERKAIARRIEELTEMIELTPKVEANYQRLVQDKNNREVRYREIMQKLQEARASIQLERGQMAERFQIIDPAVFPEEPIKPNRLALAFVGLILGVGVGVGAVAGAEALDSTFYSSSRLQVATKLPVLTVIGAIETRRDLAVRRLKRWLLAGSSVGLVLVAAMVVHFAFKPLDVLWHQLTSKITAEQAAERSKAVEQ